MSLKDLSQRIKTKIRLAQIKAAKRIAEILPDAIRFRTRYAGEGINGPLTPLKESTKKYRKRYRENLHQDTSPDESNLTATGQLLDAIAAKNVGSKIVVTVNKRRRKDELSGSRSGLTNDKVRKYVEDAGREFLELTDQERKEVIEEAEKIIKEELRSVIK